MKSRQKHSSASASANTSRRASGLLRPSPARSTTYSTSSCRLHLASPPPSCWQQRAFCSTKKTKELKLAEDHGEKLDWWSFGRSFFYGVADQPTRGRDYRRHHGHDGPHREHMAQGQGQGQSTQDGQKGGPGDGEG